MKFIIYRANWYNIESKDNEINIKGCKKEKVLNIYCSGRISKEVECYTIELDRLCDVINIVGILYFEGHEGGVVMSKAINDGKTDGYFLKNQKETNYIILYDNYIE